METTLLEALLKTIAEKDINPNNASKAFNELFYYFKEKIKLTSVLLSKRNKLFDKEKTANDICQTMFIEIFNNAAGILKELEKENLEISDKNFLKITRRICNKALVEQDILMGRKQIQNEVLESFLFDDKKFIEALEGMSDERKNRFLLLKSELDKLSPQNRKILQFFYCSPNLKYTNRNHMQSICNELGISSEGVRKRRNRTIKSMKSKILDKSNE